MEKANERLEKKLDELMERQEQLQTEIRDLVRKLNEESVKALAQPEFRQKLEQVGFVVVGNTPAEFRKFIQSEIGKWREVIKAAGIQPS